MATAPSILVDDKKFLRKMKKYEKVVGKEVEQLVHNAGRLCAIECAKYTAPRGTNAESKQAGERQITRDLRGIFTIVNPTWWEEVSNMSYDALLHKKTGVVWATKDQKQISEMSGAKAWHKENKTNGRTAKLGLIDKAIIKQSVFRKYLRESLKKVGIAKAGWAIVAEQCKADVREPLKGFPSWVKRNMPKASGTVSEIKREGFGFSVKMNNKVNYSRDTLDSNSESFAVNLAKKKMMSMMGRAIRYEKAKEADLQQ